ncbi:hypothetical protein [Ferruginibacter sp.]
MNKFIYCILLVFTSGILHAQEPLPPVKQPINIKTPTLPAKGNIDPKELPTKPNTLAFMLTSHTWSFIRWWVTGSVGHSITDPAFKFLSGNVINCSLTTPEAKIALQSGTYSINGNNVTIILKKESECNDDV